jgi:hypothetical protein
VSVAAIRLIAVIVRIAQTLASIAGIERSC